MSRRRAKGVGDAHVFSTDAKISGMTLFDSPAFEAHEAVHAFNDEKTGLKTIIAVHSTARGPAAGGVRMWPYETAEAALDDVLRLSRAMSYKNAVADLDLGGGKAVIIGDSRTQQVAGPVRGVRPRRWTRWAAATGRRRTSASPRPISLAARRQTRWIAGLEGRPAASGDPSPVTAEGVFRGMKLAAEQAFGSGDLAGLTVAIQGVGHVGGYLADKLHAAGARS